ncbi:putative acetyl transferase [Pseudomonas phage OBP]|uniref:acetyltransferase n=1 Tax=Pseudomonas phage OBP TaxID=1124849 RepID=UPI000240D5D4|nr:acetyltransferase [Pseudomonas phage OBP]AEV89677.1 putative acetyl transferase [Pseudomonas phage OBP]
MGVEIRILTNDDLRTIPTRISSGIIKLVKGLTEVEQPLTRFDFERVPSEVATYGLDFYLAPGNIMTIALNTVTSEVLGMVINKINDVDHLKVSALWYLYIVPECRGKGLGRQLMESSEEMSRRLGANSMLLSVLPDNLSAIEFYNELGYKPQLINLAKDL